jgi:hypothetical protein
MIPNFNVRLTLGLKRAGTVSPGTCSKPVTNRWELQYRLMFACKRQSEQYSNT